MDLGEFGLCEADFTPIAMDEVAAGGAAETIAHRDAADSAGIGGYDGGYKSEFSLGHRDTGENHKGFFGDGESEDAKSQQAEESQATILVEPQKKRALIR
jgi:hypothetical protein